MNWMRIKAIYTRYTYNILSLDHATELFFWPLIDILLWGITVFWIQSLESKYSIILPILTALIMWQVVWRSNYEISVNILKDLWSRNFVNLFSTPMKISEWIASLMLLGLTKNVITVVFGALTVMIFYSENIFSLGWALLPFLISLIISGWWCGFLSSSIIIYFGQRMQMIAWITGYLFSPFCAVFYPLKALPTWCHGIAHALPMTYVFEGMRAFYQTSQFDWTMFAWSMGLNFIYLALSIALFVFMFEKSREKGLARLD